MNLEQVEYFLQSGLRISTPLLLAGLGELVAERSGIINIGIEGKILLGAFAGFSVAAATGSLTAGVIAAMMAGVLLAILFGVFCIRMRNDQIVTGAAINFLALGISGLLYKLLYGTTGSTTTIRPYGEINLLNLQEIPLVGPVLFSQTLLTYLALILLLGFIVLDRYTRLGFHLSAVGEHARAADAAGIPVARVRWSAVLIEGALAGLAGAALSLSLSNTFNENMSNGRGFIAIAIVIFGRWKPLGVFLGALVFGGATALQLLLQASDQVFFKTNYPYLQMLPYLLTLLVLAVAMQKSESPQNLGQHYHRE